MLLETERLLLKPHEHEFSDDSYEVVKVPAYECAVFLKGDGRYIGMVVCKNAEVGYFIDVGE